MQSLVQSKGFSAALDQAGGQNKYQLKALCILMFQLFFRACFIIYYAFLSQPPVFLCRDPDNPEVFYDCGEKEGCDGERILSENSPSSLVNELGLYCEKSYFRTLASTLFFVGGNFGAGIYSYLSDANGRKPAMRLSYLMGSLSLLLLGTVAIGPLTYVLCIMLVWGNYSPYCTICATYVSEVCNEKYGKNATLVMILSTVVAEMFIIAVAYIIPNWRVVYLGFIVIPALVANLTFKLLDETPAFLCGKRDFVRAAEVLNKIAEVNNKQIDTHAGTGEKMSVKAPMQSQPTRSWNYIQILMHPKLRLRVLIFSILKFYLNMAFFGCIFALSSLGGSIYVNSFIAAFAEGLGYILSFKAYLFSTRKLLKGSLQIAVASGISFLLIPTISSDDALIFNPIFLQGFLALVMRTALCFISGFALNLGNEIFPAEVRCQSIGVSEIFSALGGMVAPFVIVVAEMNNLSPLFLFGSLGFIVLTTSKYLPDSQITSLDDKDNDVEMNYMKMVDKEKRSMVA